jgi:hypothetical protein
MRGGTINGVGGGEEVPRRFPGRSLASAELRGGFAGTGVAGGGHPLSMPGGLRRARLRLTAPGLIEVEVRDRVRLGGIEGGRLVEVEEGIGVERRVGSGRGARGGAVWGSPRWRRMPTTVKASVRKARMRISAPRSGQRSGKFSRRGRRGGCPSRGAAPTPLAAAGSTGSCRGRLRDGTGHRGAAPKIRGPFAGLQGPRRRNGAAEASLLRATRAR